MECKVLVLGNLTQLNSFINLFDVNFKDCCEDESQTFKKYSIKCKDYSNFKFMAINNLDFEDQNAMEYSIFDVCVKNQYLNTILIILESNTSFFNIINIAKCLKFMFRKEFLENVCLCFLDFKKDNNILHGLQFDQIASILNVQLEKKNYFIQNGESNIADLKKKLLESREYCVDIEEILKAKLKSIETKHSSDLNYFTSMFTLSKKATLMTTRPTSASVTDLIEPIKKKFKLEDNKPNVAYENAQTEKKLNDLSKNGLSMTLNENSYKPNLIQPEKKIQPYDEIKNQHHAEISSNKNENNITTKSTNFHENEHKTFLILGEAGSGKSTFINYMANYFEGSRNFDEIISDPSKLKIAIDTANWTSNLIKRFSNYQTEKNIYDKTKSQTFVCRDYDFNDKNSNKQIKLIDTPGVNDTEGNNYDMDNFEKIKDACLKQSHLNGVIFVINGSKCRNDINIRNFIEFISQLLPDKLKKNIILVATNSTDSDCNFDFKILKEGFMLNNIFYMQNSFFKWDKSKNYTKNALVRFRTNWQDSVSTITSILNILNIAEPISTDIFHRMNFNEISIASKIRNVLTKNLKDLFLNYDDKKLQSEALPKIHDELFKNWYQRKNYSIPAIKNGYHTTMYVSLPDNAAIYKYENYEKQLIESKEKRKQLDLDIQKIEKDIYNVLYEIKSDCNTLINLNKNFNFAEKFGKEYSNLFNVIKNKQFFQTYLINLENSLGFKSSF